MENAKLVRENNDLHQQLIRAQEELQSTSQDLKTRIRKLEHENADLRFLNSQYVHKVRSLEQDSKSKADKILQLQEKNLHAVVQTPGTVLKRTSKLKVSLMEKQHLMVTFTANDTSMLCQWRKSLHKLAMLGRYCMCKLEV